MLERITAEGSRTRLVQVRRGTRLDVAPDERLQEISGIVPALNALPPGCAFTPRCAKAVDRCRVERPTLETKADDHLAACWQA